MNLQSGILLIVAALLLGCKNRDLEGRTGMEMRLILEIACGKIHNHGLHDAFVAQAGCGDVTTNFVNFLKASVDNGLLLGPFDWFYDGDAWGRSYRVFAQTDDMQIRLRIVSSGRDGKWFNSDDVEVEYAIFRSDVPPVRVL